MNPSAFAQLDQFGMRYASDGRSMLKDDGSLLDPNAGPYRLSFNDQVSDCVQMPTTLPTLDELLGREINGKLIDESNIAAHILELTRESRNHVFTLHAELEGQKLAPIFEQLLQGWQQQGYNCVSMADYYNVIQHDDLPVYPIQWAELPGRSGELIAQVPLGTN